jgi:hypothetical protein
MIQPVKKHFSTSDWNFYNSSWLLDTSDYVDPPAALRFTSNINVALLKQASVGMPIPEGIIETYFKHRTITPTAYKPFCLFRSQISDGQADITSAYRIELRGTSQASGSPINRARLIRAPTTLEEKSLDPPINTLVWERIRVKFWTYAGVFFVSLEKYGDGGWVKLCSDWSDPVNSWATSSINRVGIAALNEVPCLFDVTKIYRRVS